MKEMKRYLAATMVVTMAVNTVPAVALPIPALAAQDSATSSNIPKGTLALGGLFDVKSLEAGTTKYLYINTYPEKGTEITSVESSDPDVVKVSHGNNTEGMTEEPGMETDNSNYNYVKLEAQDVAEVKEATVTVTVKDVAGNLGEVTESFTVQVIPAEYNDTQRKITDISQNWKFLLERDMASTPAEGQVPGDDAGAWEEVTIPHCWNTDDGADGGDNYHKGTGWYVRDFSAAELQEAMGSGTQLYLEMGAACKISEVYVNGKKIDRHEGGYSRIRVDLTDHVNLGENNTIAVSVNNEVNGLTPHSGDFTVFGGLYRDISLISTGDVHMDLDQKTSYGGRGLYVSQQGAEDVKKDTKFEDVFGNGGKLTVSGDIKNSADTPQDVSAVVTVYDAEWNEVVQQDFEMVSVAPGAIHEFTKEIIVPVTKETLWDGVDNPYQYNVEFEVYADGQMVDRERDRIGFRFFCADPEEGFFLNGRSYPLRGVNSHQDRYNRGYAATHQDREQDMAMMAEMGANAIRFAHYQHDPFVYELAAERGITVWAEIPMVNSIKNTNEFYNSTINNMKELIYQAYNIPSVLMWGIHNEQWPDREGITVMLDRLYKVCKEEDPSRLVTVATAQDPGDDVSDSKWDVITLSWQSDISAWNKYFGIYQGKDARYFGNWIDQVYAYGAKHKTIHASEKDATNPDGKHEDIPVYVHGNVGMSEYGAEGNPYIHTENPGYWQDESNLSEEWQTRFHEIYYKKIAESPWMWGSYIWNMFEFGSDKRANAGRQGTNNKGIVSYDRTIKKDSFYFYQANWSDEPALKIAGERFTTRNQDDIQVTVYSNMEDVELFVDGVSQGKLVAGSNNEPALNESGQPDDTLIPNTQLGKFFWDVKLTGQGEHTVVAVGTGKDGKTYTDTVVWNRKFYETAEVSSKVYNVNSASHTISGVPGGTTVETLKANLAPVQNSTFEVYTEDGQTVADEAAAVEIGMIVRVTAEDGKTTADYVITTQPVTQDKKTSSSTDQSGYPSSNAVDGDTASRWGSGKGFPGWIQVDLGDTYNLDNLDTLWYASSGRNYTFEVLGSTNGQDYYTLLPSQTSTQGDVEPTWTAQTFDDEAQARYLKLNITACSSGGQSSPSIYEIQANGFRLTSDLYSVNNTTRVINGVEQGTTVDDLLDAIAVDGDYNRITVENAENGVLTQDSLVTVAYGENGKTVSYTLSTSGPDSRPISQGKTATALEIEVNGKKIPNEDSGDGCNLNRDHDVAANLVDGDLATRWTGALTESGHTIPANAYPAEVLIDLKDEYVLNGLYLKAFNSSTKRYYKFAVYAGNDPATIKSDENMILDMRNNTSQEEIQEEVSGKGRYVLLSVTGRTTDSSYHAASIYEMGVYGYRAAGEEYTFNEEDKLISGVPVQVTVEEFLKTLDIKGNYSAEVVIGDKVLEKDDILTPGAKLRICNLEGQEPVDYTIEFEETGYDTLPVSQGMDVHALDVETDEGTVPNEDAAKGDYAYHINDGNANTYWVGAFDKAHSNCYYPAAVNVEMTDLKSTDEYYYLTGVKVDFFKGSSNNRYYKYNISAKNIVGIETGFEVNGQGNTTVGMVEHWTENGTNQIKDLTLTVTGCSDKASYAAAKVAELQVYAWRVYGRDYEIDETNKTIAIGTAPITVAELRNGLEILGNCQVVFTDAAGTKLGWDDPFTAGCKMVVTDVKDHEFVYKAVTEGGSENPDEEGFYTTSIQVTKEPDQMEYSLNEAFDPTGMVVEKTMKATASDATKVVEIPHDELKFEYDFSQVGEQDVTVAYEGRNADGDAETFTDILTVTVDEFIPGDDDFKTEKIVVKKNPDKMNYQIDEEFDPAGMVVEAIPTATDSNASPSNAKANTVIPNDELEFKYDFSKAGKAEVTIIYTEENEAGDTKDFETTLTVTVEEVAEDFYTEKITVKKKPSKLIYQTGDDFEPDGMVVEATEKSLQGSERTVTLTDEDLDYEYDFSTPGRKEVTIVYYGLDKNQEEKRFTAKVTVDVAAEADDFYTKGIEITKLPKKLQYYVGDMLDPSGIEICAVVADRETGEESKVVLTDGYKISPSVLMTAGTTTVTVSYAAIAEDGEPKLFKDTFEVKVRKYNSGDSGSSSSGSSSGSAPVTAGGVTAAEGNWTQDAAGNWYFSAQGKEYKNQWAFVRNGYANSALGQLPADWFRFDENGKMVTGWFTDADGSRYYLSEKSDGTRGHMVIGWNLIKGADGTERWYYFNMVSDGTKGKLLTNTTTPDGYQVDENGCWIQ